MTMVSATLGAVSGSTALTVSSAKLMSIAVTPADQSVSKGATVQYKATGTYSDMSTQDLTTQVSWTSSSNKVALVSNAPGSQGLATAVSAGATTIKATLATVSGSTSLMVKP
jgi:hypothetical protein